MTDDEFKEIQSHLPHGLISDTAQMLFVHHARDDIPKLLDEIKRLRRIEETRKLVDCSGDYRCRHYRAALAGKDAG